MSHVILLGDSIFNNAVYVPGGPPVIDQLRTALPVTWRATLVAVDGHTVQHMPEQLPRVPADATHLVVSVGGNNALMAAGLLTESARSVGEALAKVANEAERFHTAYADMLKSVRERGLPTAVCTVYDAVPVIGGAERAALAGFNDVITRAAVSAGVPLLDLRVICNDPGDYSPLSPIEPSVAGGAKIAAAICRMLAGHDFGARRTTVWV